LSLPFAVAESSQATAHAAYA